MFNGARTRIFLTHNQACLPFHHKHRVKNREFIEQGFFLPLSLPISPPPNYFDSFGGQDSNLHAFAADFQFEVSHSSASV